MKAIHRLGDSPTLYLGDFNTMGCPQCSQALTDKVERRSFEVVAEGQFIDISPSCSQYYRGKAGLLDGAFIRGKLPGKRWQGIAGGVCGDLSCQPAPVSRFSYSREVSDHCPLAFFP